MQAKQYTVETMITDYDWCESSRPIVMIDESGLSIRIHVGGSASLAKLANIELTSKDLEGLVSQLEGYREIFDATIEHLKRHQAASDQD